MLKDNIHTGTWYFGAIGFGSGKYYNLTKMKFINIGGVSIQWSLILRRIFLSLWLIKKFHIKKGLYLNYDKSS